MPHHPNGPNRPDRPEDAATLFEAHADMVAAWASRLGGPQLDVDDAVQEVFIVVHRRLARFRGESTLKSWLYGITAHVVQHQRRKAKRRRWFGGSADDDYQLMPPPQPTPVEELERKRRTMAVYRVLDRMREIHRTVLIWFEIEGLDGEAIAELTGIRVATIWVRLHRARAEFDQLARKLIPGEVEALELAHGQRKQVR